MRILSLILFCCLISRVVYAADEPAPDPYGPDATGDDGYLGIEAGIGYNTYETSKYSKAPVFFTGGSASREITTRLLILSDIIHASDYFSGNTSFMQFKGLYLFNYGLIDIDYLSWHGKLWSAGLGGGLAHQGFLVYGADRSAHAVTARVRAQGFLYLFKYFAAQGVITLPVAFYQSATNEFRLWHTELNLLFDFKGRVRNPEPQSFLFSVSLHYDYIHLSHQVRSYSQHELTPMFKATVLY